MHVHIETTKGFTVRVMYTTNKRTRISFCACFSYMCVYERTHVHYSFCALAFRACVCVYARGCVYQYHVHTHRVSTSQKRILCT
jgi:hypothetical protein